MEDRIHVHIGPAPLVAEDAVRFVTDERAGGIAVFAGTTRRYTDDRETVELEYEAYEEMAVSEMIRLAEDALDEYSLVKAYVAHRLGSVSHGESSVLIAVSAPHRDEAFWACRWLIDRVKSQVPIWKKEKYVDGSEEWVKGSVPAVGSTSNTRFQTPNLGSSHSSGLIIGCYQLEPRLLDRAANLEAVERAFEGVSVDLAVLPELLSSGYFFSSQEDVDSVVEEIPDGPTTVKLIEIARRRRCHIVAGLPEVDGHGYFNSAVLVGPEGYIGRYRKTHLFYEEKIWFVPGDSGFPVFDVVSASGISYRLGIMICFDWFFPESARTLAASGADVIAHPSNLVKEWCPQAMPIRALENHVFTATANRTGTESNGREDLTFIGSSLICGPDGVVRASAARESTEWIVASCDLSEARDKRVTDRNEIFADRRPGSYRS